MTFFLKLLLHFARISIEGFQTSLTFENAFYISFLICFFKSCLWLRWFIHGGEANLYVVRLSQRRQRILWIWFTGKSI